MQQWFNSKTFAPTPDQEESFGRLDRLRGDLTHYGDVTRYVLVADLPRVVNDCVSIIGWLLRESHNVTLFEQELEDLADEHVRQIIAECNRLLTSYPPVRPSRSVSDAGGVADCCEDQ